MISTYVMSLEIDKLLREDKIISKNKFFKSMYGWSLTYIATDIDIGFKNKLGDYGDIRICYMNQNNLYCKVTYSLEKSKTLNHELLESYLKEYTKQAGMKYSINKFSGNTPTSYFVEVIPKNYDNDLSYDVSMVVSIPLLVLLKVN